MPMKIADVRVSFLALVVAASLLACSAETGDEAVGASSASVTTGSWSLPADVRASGAKVRVTYEGEAAWRGKSGCSGALKAGASTVAEFLDDKFTAISSIGGYSCRPNTANTSKMSVHGSGRALDVMIPTKGGAADAAKGDPVANWLVMNATKIGVQLIIWNRTVWRANGTNTKGYTGPNPHIDHVHVELTSKAAAQQTPWFADKDVTAEPGAPPANPTGPTGGSDPATDPTDPNDPAGPETEPPAEEAPLPEGETPPDEETPLPGDELPPPEGTPPPVGTPPVQTPTSETLPPRPSGRVETLPGAEPNVEELGDGPGDAESSERVTRKDPKIASSGCGVTRTRTDTGSPWLLGIALAVAGVLYRRRRRSLQ
jgi:MYXO-CTERM domain-containing protein